MTASKQSGTPISVVLAVHGVEQYLPGCLDSIPCQPSPPGIEVIAVDDARAEPRRRADRRDAGLPGYLTQITAALP